MHTKVLKSYDNITQVVIMVKEKQVGTILHWTCLYK